MSPAPFFWRWSEDYCQHIRDGIPLLYRGYPPRHFASQQKEKDPEVRNKVGTKLMTVFASQYVVYGLILSLTSFLSVPRGDTDIRMVYNDTSSGMNAHLWAPWFALPTIYALDRALEVGTLMGDSYIGEMFFKLHAGGKLRVFGGSGPYALCTQR
jgi:hypothetical protein